MGAELVGKPPADRFVWVPRTAVCDVGDGSKTRFGPVPVNSGVKAYVYNAVYGLIEEIMVFCPLHQSDWASAETDRTQSNLHYRKLHVEIGSSPSDEQLQLAKDLQGQNVNLKWLSDFVVQTLIHESTHAVAFVGSDGAKLGKFLAACLVCILTEKSTSSVVLITQIHQRITHAQILAGPGARSRRPIRIRDAWLPSRRAHKG